jgi:hypothetical protein
MQIDNLDTRKYKRFFAFGCSFTWYYWPTWADIIGREIPYYENWGRGGAGNQFIFNSLIECNLRNKFTEDDLVIVMWTSCSREDRYVDNDWLLSATENRKSVYGNTWMRRFANQDKGLMIRDFASIQSTQTLLDSFNVDWVNLNSLPLIRFDIDRAERDIKNGIASINDLETRWADQQQHLHENNGYFDEYLKGKSVVELYKDIFPNIKESLYRTILNNKKRPNFGDLHPTPIESLNYLNKVIPNNLKSNEYVNGWNDMVLRIEIVNQMPEKFVRKLPFRF